jgi:hypothetical protein
MADERAHALDNPVLFEVGTAGHGAIAIHRL